MKKEQITFEARFMSPKTIEGLTEDCLRTEAVCGNPDIEGVNILLVTVVYEFSTKRDLYRQTGVAAVVQDSEPKKRPEAEETLSKPRLVGEDDPERDFVNEPPDVFGEIDNNDGLNYGPKRDNRVFPVDPDFHEGDATGVPYETDKTPLVVRPHSETHYEELEFDEDDILAGKAEPPGWDYQH